MVLLFSKDFDYDECKSLYEQDKGTIQQRLIAEFCPEDKKEEFIHKFKMCLQDATGEVDGWKKILNDEDYINYYKTGFKKGD